MKLRVLKPGVLLGKKRSYSEIIKAEDVSKLRPNVFTALIGSGHVEIIGDANPVGNLDVLTRLEVVENKLGLGKLGAFRKGDKVNFDLVSIGGKIETLAGVILSLHSETAQIEVLKGVPGTKKGTLKHIKFENITKGQ